MTADDIRALIQFVKDETERDIAENQRKQNEQERQQAEAQRESNEVIRQAEEAQRQQNESSRQSAESARASAESVRASQESARVSAENDRIAAENARQAAESARQAAEVVREQVKNEAILATQEALDAASDATTAAASAHSAAQAANDAADRANTEAEKIENLEHKGEYDSNTLYVKNNEVRYNGSTWRALQDTQGNVPQEGPYWTLVAQRGLDGQGSVQSVAGKSPDINGDVPLSATDLSFSPPPGMTSTNTQNAIVEVFQFGNERKQGLVDALIAIGVPASISEPWEDLIDKVESVIRATGNATPSDVRAGKTFSSASGNDQVGSIPVRTGGNVTPGPNDIVKDAGIYDTAITIQKVVVPADKVLAGTTIAGTAGTMPNRGNVNQTLTQQGQEYTVPAGYHAGGGKVKAQFANLVPENVRSGVNIGGVVGEMTEGGSIVSVQFGQFSLDNQQAQVDIIISNVNPNTSIVELFYEGGLNIPSRKFRGFLTSGTNLRIVRHESIGSFSYGMYRVTTFENVNVQSGSVAVPNGSRGTYVNISSIDINKAQFFWSWTGGAGTNTYRTYVFIEPVSSTQFYLRFHSEGEYIQDRVVQWYAVEFP